MNDQDKTKQQLLDELAELRQRVAALEDVDRQRRQAEEELAKSKAILTAAMDCLPFDFYALDPTGRCMLQNAVSRQRYGSAVGKTAEQVCPDERALPRWLEGNRRALAGQRVEEESTWCVAGEQRQFFSIMAPIQQDGTLYGILGVNVDITQLKHIEEALRTSERRYRALAESTRDIIFILDREGSLCYANQAALQCIGISAADIVGKRQVDLFPPEMAQSQLQMVGRVFATGEVVEYDDLFQFGPGKIWLRIHLLPLRDEAGQITSVMGVCHNITDRKRAEEALRKAHDDLDVKVRQRTAELARANEELAIFHKFAEASGQGFSMADLDSRITYMNPTLCRMLGEEKPEDAVGQHISAYYSEPSNRRGREEIEPALKQRGYWEGELPMLSRQGKSIPTWQNSFLIRDDSGNPFRLAVVITDITERKQAEEALRREHRTLEHMLQSSDHERQLIAYDIHDGLAQYLTGAIMQLDVAHQIRAENPGEAAKAYDAGILMVRQSLAEARRLISGVRPPILDESGIVAAVAHLVYEHRGRSGPKIKFESKVEFGRLEAILENAVYRIVQEGLTNAWKHSKSKKVSVELVQDGEDLRIVIEDQGIGFDPQAVGEGRFGLEGIRERARLLGGRSLIESTPGKGTRIVVELPIVLRKENGE